MISNEEFTAMRADVARLGSQRVASKFGLIPASIQHLEAVLAGDLTEDDRADVYSLLVNECSKALNDLLYIEVLRRRAFELANDPISHAGLAFRLALIDPSAHEEALNTGYKSLELAKSQDRQVRYCATNLARIGLMLDDYACLQHALVELVADAANVRVEDTRYEFDFVAQIDGQRCDARLLSQYNALA
jgi:hypothetical protein